MYLVHSLYMACLWGCRRLCRNSVKPDFLTTYSPKKYLKLDVGWFHPCIQCGILTSNELSYMILIRRDYEQITINCCRVCRRSKLSNKWIYSINEIHFTPHKIIRIARLRYILRYLRGYFSGYFSFLFLSSVRMIFVRFPSMRFPSRDKYSPWRRSSVLVSCL